MLVTSIHDQIYCDEHIVLYIAREKGDSQTLDYTLVPGSVKASMTVAEPAIGRILGLNAVAGCAVW